MMLQSSNRIETAAYPGRHLLARCGLRLRLLGGCGRDQRFPGGGGCGRGGEHPSRLGGEGAGLEGARQRRRAEQRAEEGGGHGLDVRVSNFLVPT